MVPIFRSLPSRTYSTSADLNAGQQNPESIAQQIRNLQESIEELKDTIQMYEEMANFTFRGRQVNKRSLPTLAPTTETLESLQEKKKDLEDKVKQCNVNFNNQQSTNLARVDNALDGIMSIREYRYY